MEVPLGNYFRARPRAIPIVILALLAVACGDRRLPTATDPGTIGSKYLTGEAATRLNANGQFTLPAPVPGAFPEISATQAQALAVVFVSRFLPDVQPDLERQHGGKIDLGRLQPCGRTFYESSAYTDVAGAIPNWARKGVGPFWMVSFCAPAGDEQVSVAVSSFDTDLSIIDGLIRFPQRDGMSLYPTGVSPSVVSIPASPERAAQLAASLTGRRVAQVPELVRFSISDMPQIGRWRITLDGPAHVRGDSTGTVSDTPELYVGVDQTLKSLKLYYARADTTTLSPEIYTLPLNGSLVTVPLARKSGVPRALESVTVTPTPAAGDAHK